MEDIEKFNNSKKRGEPFSYKDIELPHPETGEFEVRESSGKKWVGRPERPPAVVEAEKEERKKAGVAELIEQIPEEERKKIQEEVRIQVGEIIQKKQHLLSRDEIEKEFNKLYKRKEWELASKWLADHPENNIVEENDK